MHPKTNSRYSDIVNPNTCCHNVLLLAMILTSAFMYCCNIGVFCPCVLTVAVAIKFMLTYHRKIISFILKINFLCFHFKKLSVCNKLIFILFRSFSFMTLHSVLLRLTCTSSFVLAVRCVKAIADAKGNGTCGI